MYLLFGVSVSRMPSKNFEKLYVSTLWSNLWSNTKMESTLTTDASEKSISGVLTQDGHPVTYLSRRLSACERNYSNIEREALAIGWATNRARHYLMGRLWVRNFNSVQITDHLSSFSASNVNCQRSLLPD